MTKQPTSPPFLLLGAALALAAVPLTSLITLLFPMSGETRFAFWILTLSLFCFGIGQVLNHPAHSGNTFTRDTDNRFYRFHQRHRSPCALGNLLFIFSILLFCISMAKFFPF